MKKIVYKIAALAFLASVFFLARCGAAFVSAQTSGTKEEKPCIVIDAGHGGADPGKVGINGALEKDINLAIAIKLSKILENKGYQVVLTRDDDNSLAEKSAANQKRQDMVHRVEVIEEAKPLFSISIHQNSFSNESVCGPQVFYYAQSKQGEEIAQTIQKNLDKTIQPESPRKTKANNSYYLLKKTPTPTVIIECGFLSNEREATLLVTELYQDKVARAIYYGIQEYLEVN